MATTDYSQSVVSSLQDLFIYLPYWRVVYVYTAFEFKCLIWSFQIECLLVKLSEIDGSNALKCKNQSLK